MGQEATQTHKFPCRSCGEVIVVSLDVDYTNLGWRVSCEENAEEIEEVPGSPIVNLDPNFPIPSDDQGKDLVFPRFSYLKSISDAAAKTGTATFTPTATFDERNARPFRRPDYLSEWRLIKKAWSLSQNSKDKLSKRCITNGSSQFYPKDPLRSLTEWLWRFSSLICQPVYEGVFEKAVESLVPLAQTENLKSFAKVYGSNLAANRSSHYFEILKEFFAGYAEFSQVLFLVARGIDISPTHRATSIDFDQTKMFYGNAFERFSALAELLAFFNNILAGRTYDQFERLSLEKYRKLDKASRFGPFSMNGPLSAICVEADNQLRNASHHGSLDFDPTTQIIRYRVGKGGAGPEQVLPYTKYLERCARVFLQTLTLLRIELIFSNQFHIPFPNRGPR